MNLEGVVNDVTTKLANYLAANSSLKCKAEKLPETDKEYERAISENIIFVAVMGGNGDATRSTGPVIQKRKLNVAVVLHSSALYGDAGLHKIMDAVEKVLIGYKPDNCDRLIYIKDDRDKIAEHGVWLQNYNFETACMLIQDDASNSDADTQYGNLTQVNYIPSTFNEA